MTTIEPSQAESGHADQKGRLLAPWWHTALIVLLIIGLSVAGVRQLRSFGDKPLRLVANYSLTIVYEWVLAALALWGIHMRKVPLRQLLGELRPGARGWWGDIGVALGYWAGALMVLAVLGETLVKISGSHIDPQKIGDVTQKLAPITWPGDDAVPGTEHLRRLLRRIGLPRLPAAAIRSHGAENLGRRGALRVGVWRRARL